MTDFLIGVLAAALTLGYPFHRTLTDNTSLRAENHRLRRDNRNLHRERVNRQPLATVHPLRSSPKHGPIADIIAANEAARLDAEWARTVAADVLNETTETWGRP